MGSLKPPLEGEVVVGLQRGALVSQDWAKTCTSR